MGNQIVSEGFLSGLRKAGDFLETYIECKRRPQYLIKESNLG